MTAVYKRVVYMKENKEKIISIILIIITMFITAFIFINSLMDYNVSHNSSGAITGIIMPDNAVNYEILETIIRKLAHLVEYAFLGMAVMSLILNVRKQYKKTFYGFAFFYVLIAAVVDEYIQSFSDRSSSTGDILLDFSGAVIGFLIIILIFRFVIWLKQYRKGIQKSKY